MSPQPKRVIALAAAALAAATALAACGKSSSPGTGTSSGKPASGGTLRLVANGGPANNLDPVPSYTVTNYIMEHVFARQLLSYPTVDVTGLSGPSWSKAIGLIPDVATAVPSTANHGISADGLTYTFHLRSGVDWSSAPPRQVTAGDFIREYKAFCNPVSPVGNIGYFTSTISGLSSYCNAENAHFGAKNAPTATPSAIAAWQNGHTISGITAPNPIWKQAADPVRHQYVSKILVTMGTSSTQTALADMQANSQDLSLDLVVPPVSIPGLQSSPQFHIWPDSNSAFYVLFNLRSWDAGGAMGKLAVRQAVTYAVNKADIQKILGGPSINKVISTAIPPGNSGYAPYNPYPSPGNAGDAAKCRTVLAGAGYPHGFTATYLYQNDTVGTAIFQAIQAAVAKCGITLKGKSETGATYFTTLGDSPVNNKPNQWDMATGSWYPDWFGNNGRSVIQPLFQTSCVLNTVNDGCYSSKTEDSLITQALKAPAAAAAASLWQQADQVAMKDAVIVPLIDQYVAQYASSRVHSAAGGTENFSEAIDGPDLTSIWLNPNHP